MRSLFVDAYIRGEMALKPKEALAAVWEAKSEEEMTEADPQVITESLAGLNLTLASVHALTTRWRADTLTSFAAGAMPSPPS